jgi:hypothetical protein
MPLARSILQKPRHRWLLGLLCWLKAGTALSQTSPVLFPQMPEVTRFRLLNASRWQRKHFAPLQLIQQPTQANGKNYTAFQEQRSKKPSEAGLLPFTLRLEGDSLLMPITLYEYTPLAHRTRLLDSLGTRRLEGTFLRFGAAVGTSWTCLTSYSWYNKWNSITTQLREIRKTPEGELLYVIAFREDYYGVSDSEFWREFVFSRERGIVQLTGEGMVGGRVQYEREDHANKSK